jgi:hypothetical protein
MGLGLQVCWMRRNSCLFAWGSESGELSSALKSEPSRLDARGSSRRLVTSSNADTVLSNLAVAILPRWAAACYKRAELYRHSWRVSLKK